MMIYSALNISKLIINHEHFNDREVSNLRLQKLLYFIQAKALKETGEPCFFEEIEAWAFGPVVPVVYHEYQIFGGLDITRNEPINFPLETKMRNLITNILDYCERYTTSQLVKITHNQSPWINARLQGEHVVITNEAIKQYFSQNE